MRGNKTPIQPGLCFSVEPTGVIYGEFGLRLEGAAYITPGGAEILHESKPFDRQPFG